jgi:hypothetical protein
MFFNPQSRIRARLTLYECGGDDDPRPVLFCLSTTPTVRYWPALKPLIAAPVAARGWCSGSVVIHPLESAEPAGDLSLDHALFCAWKTTAVAHRRQLQQPLAHLALVRRERINWRHNDTLYGLDKVSQEQFNSGRQLSRQPLARQHDAA